MKIIETPIKDLLVLEINNFQDKRGNFCKMFSYDFFRESNIDTDFKEFYFSISYKNVIRGMHFQTPPFDHSKLIYVSKGHIKDVVLDIRKNSQTFGRYYEIELSVENAKCLYVPKGLAHGFLSMEDGSIVNYAQTSCYSKEHDSGILYNSFGYEWNVEKPVISERDLSLNIFSTFQSPF